MRPGLSTGLPLSKYIWLQFMHLCTPHQEKSFEKQDHLSGWLKPKVDAEALSSSPSVSPARERCETVGLATGLCRFCACVHSLPLLTSADSGQSAESTHAIVRIGRDVVFSWCALASGARERTETAGWSAGLGRFCARQAWKIGGSAEEKRSPAAGAGAGVSGESEEVWSPAQRVSTRRSRWTAADFIITEE